MSLDASSRAPEWLYRALDDALVSIGATADAKVRRAEIDKLVSAWNMSGRSFHNARYLSSVLEQLDSLEAASTDPEILRVAFAYRGAEYEVGWEDARMEDTPTSVPRICTSDDLARLGVPQENIDRVKDLVTQLGQHAPRPGDLDAKIIIDADMAILASAPQQYRKLLEGLRGEVPFMDSEDFLRWRRRSIKRLLSRRHIFFSPVARRWDDVARENLEAELNSIEARLSADDEDTEPLPVDEEQSDKVVIRHSLRSPSRLITKIEVPGTSGRETLDSTDPSDAAAPELSNEELDREDDLASTSTLEVLPDIFDAIRRRQN